ncbi:hypothetical protein [Sphingomonas sp. PR090111-T3T-6A]|uniref:hypothetical protein n=1 Tax=Sphingomonas sp. PR090111-T3T-6A TaxID=685778 RepID=UPI00036B126C|nr:hypothetical protein [Sphingomonas sp. PR090111-T3T-6A]
MIHVLRALAGLALIVPTVAGAARPHQTVKARPAKGDVEPAIVPSEAVKRVAEWVTASKDNHSLPWAVVDKPNAALFLFDPGGKPLDAVPVLIGIAVGDEASPGVGSKKLADLGPAEKTTPAGRFLAKFGMPVGGERVLWVDYATSVALHPIPKDAGAREHRRERMLSPTSDDNRITFGCINVPKVFYGSLLSPLFRKKGGYVYVLPDTKPIEEVFPRLRVQAAMNGNAGP